MILRFHKSSLELFNLISLDKVCTKLVFKTKSDGLFNHSTDHIQSSDNQRSYKRLFFIFSSPLKHVAFIRNLIQSHRHYQLLSAPHQRPFHPGAV